MNRFRTTRPERAATEGTTCCLCSRLCLTYFVSSREVYATAVSRALREEREAAALYPRRAADHR